MASTRLTRTVGTPTLNTKYTFSFWVKRAKLTYSDAFIIDGRVDASNRFKIAFQSADKIEFWNTHGGSDTFSYNTNRQFRDVNGWYHIVAAVDTTDSTAGDRVKLYVNGERETSFASSTNPSQNDANNVINENGATINIGAYYNNTYGYEGCISHFHFIDGTAYAPTVFGSTDSTTGEWKINTSPSVTYGNNGFFILKDAGSVTDQSGNGNNFTVANGTLTNTEDCPSNVFATLNPLTANCTLSNGNNTWVATQSGYEHSSATLGASSGKYYWEVKPNGPCGAMGITDFNWQFDRRGSLIYTSNSYAWVYEGNGYVSHNSYGDIASNYSTYTSSDIIGVALDLDNNKLYFHKNGTYENSGDPTSGSTGTGAISIDAPSSLPSGFYSPLVADLCSASVGGGDVNFGNGYFGTTAISSEGTNASNIGKFEYDVPTGYTALSTKGLNE